MNGSRDVVLAVSVRVGSMTAGHTDECELHGRRRFWVGANPWSALEQREASLKSDVHGASKARRLVRQFLEDTGRHARLDPAELASARCHQRVATRPHSDPDSSLRLCRSGLCRGSRLQQHSSRAAELRRPGDDGSGDVLVAAITLECEVIRWEKTARSCGSASATRPLRLPTFLGRGMSRRGPSPLPHQLDPSGGACAPCRRDSGCRPDSTTTPSFGSSSCIAPSTAQPRSTGRRPTRPAAPSRTR